MLKTIPPTLTPDLLWVIAAMGHGDRLALVNANYPAYARHERVIALPGVSLVDAAAAILQLMPIDDTIDAPAFCMVPDGRPGDRPDVHRDVQHALDAAEGRAVGMRAIERMPFFDLAATSFAAVATSDNRPFGCFVITKGVVRAALPSVLPTHVE
jgi:L-fucose mutarotase